MKQPPPLPHFAFELTTATSATAVPLAKVASVHAELGLTTLATIPPPKQFFFSRIFVPTLEHMAALWAEMRWEPQSCLLLGDPVPTLDLARSHRRLLKQSQDGDAPTLRSIPRSWCILDLDGPEFPDDIANAAEAIRHPEHVVRHVRSLLPDPFHSVSCAWAWTGSMGYRRDRKARLRLAFVLGWPFHPGHLGLYFDRHGAPVDPASFRPVQPIFTAAPVANDTRARPWAAYSGAGVGILHGTSNTVLLDPDEINSIVRDNIAGACTQSLVTRQQGAAAILSGHGAARSLADIRAVILRGDDGLHDALRTYTYRLARAGLAPETIENETRALLNTSAARERTPGRWQERFADLPRVISGAFNRAGRFGAA